MTFDTAIRKLLMDRQNKRMKETRRLFARRAFWDDWTRLVIEGRGSLYVSSDSVRKDRHDAHLTVEDVLANDWEVGPHGPINTN